MVSFPSSLSVDLLWNETSIPNSMTVSDVIHQLSLQECDTRWGDRSGWFLMEPYIQNASPNCKRLHDLSHYFDRFKTLPAIQICMSTSRSLDSHLKFMIIYKSAWPFRESLHCFVLVKGILMFCSFPSWNKNNQTASDIYFVLIHLSLGNMVNTNSGLVQCMF